MVRILFPQKIYEMQTHVGARRKHVLPRKAWGLGSQLAEGTRPGQGLLWPQRGWTRLEWGPPCECSGYRARGPMLVPWSWGACGPVTPRTIISSLLGVGGLTRRDTYSTDLQATPTRTPHGRRCRPGQKRTSSRVARAAANRREWEMVSRALPPARPPPVGASPSAGAPAPPPAPQGPPPLFWALPASAQGHRSQTQATGEGSRGQERFHCRKCVAPGRLTRDGGKGDVGVTKDSVPPLPWAPGNDPCQCGLRAAAGV